MKKIISYIFLVVVLLAGLFGIAQDKVSADTANTQDASYLTQHDPRFASLTDLQKSAFILSINNNPNYLSEDQLKAAADKFIADPNGTITSDPNLSDQNKTDATKKPDPDTCGISNIPACILLGISKVIIFFCNAILYFFSWLLFIAGTILNIVLYYTLYDMKGTLGTIGVISTGWTLFRNIANMIFIFVLLYISIGTVLSLEGFKTKEMLKKVIIYGLLLNFSFFFTNVVIDASNIFSIGFYQNIATNNAISITAPLGGTNTFDGGLSSVIVSKLYLQTIYSPSTGTSALSGVVGTGAALGGAAVGTVAYMLKLITLVAGGSLFMFITAFILLVAAILFLVRFVVLIFILILSPLAFAAAILPKTKKYSDLWWEKLLEQAQFAPVFMALLAFSILAIGGTNKILGVGGSASQTFVDAFTQPPTFAVVGIVFNFAVAIAFLVGTIVIAKKLGALGTDAAKTGAGALTFGLAARAGNRVARRIGESETLRQFTKSNPVLGSYVSDKLSTGMDLRNIPGAAGYLGKGVQGYKKDADDRAAAIESARKTVLSGAEGKVKDTKVASSKANKEANAAQGKRGEEIKKINAEKDAAYLAAEQKVSKARTMNYDNPAERRASIEKAQEEEIEDKKNADAEAARKTQQYDATIDDKRRLADNAALLAKNVQEAHDNEKAEFVKNVKTPLFGKSTLLENEKKVKAAQQKVDENKIVLEPKIEQKAKEREGMELQVETMPEGPEKEKLLKRLVDVSQEEARMMDEMRTGQNELAKAMTDLNKSKRSIPQQAYVVVSGARQKEKEGVTVEKTELGGKKPKLEDLIKAVQKGDKDLADKIQAQTATEKAIEEDLESTSFGSKAVPGGSKEQEGDY